ncbi:hypothetical protein TNCV_3827941 [Trichonephila clavipes]|nr:hypothetical protein TNCV_3827941 [Trichonephila clavipes]
MDEIMTTANHSIWNWRTPKETQRNVSPEQVEDERGPMPTSAITDLFEKVGGCQSNGLRMALITQLMSVGLELSLFIDNAINYFWKILKKSKRNRHWTCSSMPRSPELINRFHIEVYGESMIG